MSILQLPPEIITEVLLLLPQKDLINAQLWCSYCKYVLYNSEIAKIRVKVFKPKNLTPNTQFEGVKSVASMADGRLVILDQEKFLVSFLNPKTGETTKLIQGNSKAFSQYNDGPIECAGLSWPYSVLVDDNDNIIITDTGHRTVREINTRERTIRTLAGTPKKKGFSPCVSGNNEAEFNWPYGMCFDHNGDILATDFWNHCIYIISRKGDVRVLAGRADITKTLDGPIEDALFTFPSSIAIDPNSNDIYVADSTCIRRIFNGIVETVVVHEKFVWGLVIDEQSNIYFASHDGLFKRFTRRRLPEVIKLRTNPKLESYYALHYKNGKIYAAVAEKKKSELYVIDVK